LLLALCLAFCVHAEDEAAAADDVKVTEDAAVAGEGEGEAAVAGEGEGEALSEEDANAKAAAYIDSAKELQEKLGQLKALLDAKGDDADPALKERLKGLEQQLSGIGLGGGGLGGGEVGSSPELTEFLGGCVSMSVRRVGLQRPSTMNALARMTEGKMTPAEASHNELWRMIGVCISEYTEDEFEDFKRGKTTVLPKPYVEKAKSAEAEAMVTSIEEGVWKELKVIAKSLLGQMTQDKEKPPMEYGYLAGIPMLLMIGFLVKKFLDMQKDKDDKAAKKEKKKDSGKKSR